MGKAIPLRDDRAYERIKHDIVTCAIAPGASEAQLCAHHRLGRALVHMALARLAREGLVRSVPRPGYVVTAVTLKDIHDASDLQPTGEVQ